MKWYIIRHAEKEQGNFYNPVLRHQDQPLSKRGRADAENLCPYFTDKTISSIYVSEYLRTRQTSEHLANQFKLSPIVDNRLNEFDNGLVDGLNQQELKEKFPDVWNALRSRDRDFQFPEGESGDEVLQRIKSFFAEKLKHNQDIILVSHDGLIRILICHLLGLASYRRWDFQVDTCGIMEIEYDFSDKRWKLIRFNQICQGPGVQ